MMSACASLSCFAEVSCRTSDLFDDDLLVIVDADNDLVVAKGDAVAFVNDAQATEVCAALVADPLEPLECFGKKLGIGFVSGVNGEQAVAKVERHQFCGDDRTGVHEGDRGRGTLPGRAQEAQIDWTSGTIAVEVIVDEVLDFCREVVETDASDAH